ncbi:MAG TPA: polyphenol oxidase family protein, partial [Anaerovoracaceae bacterium]|nr:polyphenol oxidase family protein [Anaerovoracaceae bacterium]
GAQDLETAVYDTDAVFTYEPNVLLCTFTSDCIPVIFYNEDEGLIGVIHSGWQGTVKEITLKVFRYIMNSKGCSPKNMRVYIGKSISGEKFEVDEDVYLKFKCLNYAQPYICYNEKTCKYHIDNKSIVKSQCELAGIPSTNIFIDPTCTYSDPDCFSYRRDKRCGRHMGFVLRNL